MALGRRGGGCAEMGWGGRATREACERGRRVTGWPDTSGQACRLPGWVSFSGRGRVGTTLGRSGGQGRWRAAQGPRGGCVHPVVTTQILSCCGRLWVPSLARCSAQRWSGYPLAILELARRPAPGSGWEGMRGMGRPVKHRRAESVQPVCSSESRPWPCRQGRAGTRYLLSGACACPPGQGWLPARQLSGPVSPSLFLARGTEDQLLPPPHSGSL